ncbi:MAG: type II toxin-antitoxin system VapC family toxin [Desulfamplus sp.]|nr:type II toxin-antitoxin system VapC family toxin [Desulfamplus sp.]
MENLKLCLDTDVIIRYLKGREPVASAVEKAVINYESYITSITVYELLFGVERAKKEIGEQELLGIMTILPFDYASAKRAATLHSSLISKNMDIGIKDILIASICLENNIPIFTANDKHFSRVNGLNVVTYSQI